jgi:lipoprotein Spr
MRLSLSYTYYGINLRHLLLLFFVMTLSVQRFKAAPLPTSLHRDTCMECDTPVSATLTSIAIEDIPTLRIKYALLLDTTLESLNNDALYQMIDPWIGVPYRYGGKDSTGIDCSFFSGIIYQNMYGITLPRTSKEQSERVTVLETDEWKEGDLLFFKTGGKQISHVGIYLGNGKFVHASTIKGVTIDNLDFPYYKKRFVFGGRITANE